MSDNKVDELKRIYKKESKALDQRLRELEKRGRKQYGYKSAEKTARKWFGDQARPRFEKVPKTDDVRKLRKMINEVRRLKDMPSTSLRKMRKITKKAAKTLKRNTGLDLDPKQLGNFFESEEYKKLIAEGYDSDTITRSIGKMQQDTDKIKKALDQFKTYHVHGNYQNVAVRNFIEKRIAENDFDIDEFFDKFGM